jgi:spore germination protein (amino acid permease)
LNEKVNAITPFQLMTVVLSAQIGLGILTFPADIAELSKHDAWIPTILGGAAFTVLILLLYALLNRYGSKSIIEINTILFGPIVGNAVNVVILAYFCLSTLNGIRLYCEYIKMTVLVNTPSVILTCFIMLPIFYTAWYGLKIYARFSAISYIGIALTLIIIALIFEQLHFIFLLPIGATGVSSVLQGSFSTTYALLGPEIIAILFPYVTEKKKVLKYLLLANTFTTVFYAIVVLATTAMFGEDMLEKLVIPVIVLARTYFAPIFERIDLFYFALWVPNLATSVGAYFLTAELGFRQLFHITKRDKLTLCLFTVFMLALSRIPKNFNQESTIMRIIAIFGLSVIGLMIICLVISFFRKKGVL